MNLALEVSLKNVANDAADPLNKTQKAPVTTNPTKQ